MVVPYWNAYVVLSPLGLTVAFRTAAWVVIDVAVAVAAVGTVDAARASDADSMASEIASTVAVVASRVLVVIVLSFPKAVNLSAPSPPDSLERRPWCRTGGLLRAPLSGSEPDGATARTTDSSCGDLRDLGRICVSAARHVRP